MFDAARDPEDHQQNPSQPPRPDLQVKPLAGVKEARAGTPAPAGPFVFDHVFDVNEDLIVKNADIPGVPAVIIENVLKHPAEARTLAANTPATNWKRTEGGRNFVDYYDCRLRFSVWPPNRLISFAQQTIYDLCGLETRPQVPQIDVNWFMQIREKRADIAFPHHDIVDPTGRTFSCLVYLNNQAECSGGTAFMRFKPSNSLVVNDVFHNALRTNPRMGENGADYWPEKPGELWDTVGAVDMVPGRMLIFPSEYFHAAYHPLNSYYTFPRMTLVFWMIHYPTGKGAAP